MPKSELPLADEQRAERCEACRFAQVEHRDRIPQHGNPSGQSVRLTHLECRRRAPVCSVTEASDLLPGDTFWPVVAADGWCGEWATRDYPQFFGPTGYPAQGEMLEIMKRLWDSQEPENV